MNDVPPYQSGSGSHLGEYRNTAKSRVMAVVEVMLTPKYILLVLTALFAGTSIYSRVQVANLKDALDSYKEATAATTELQSSLTKTVSGIKGEKDQLNDTILALRDQLLKSETELRNTSTQFALSKQQIDTLALRNEELTKELEGFRSARSDDVKALQEKLDAAQAAASKLALKNKELEGGISTAEQLKNRAQEQASKNQDILANQSRQMDEMRAMIDGLSAKNSALEQDRTTLTFAKTVIDNVKREANRFRDMDEDAIEKWIGDFERAEKNIKN